MMPTIVEMALQEAALRLAWYTRTHGGIPAAQIMKLQLSASGGRRDIEADELLNEANLIRDYLLEICTSRQK